MEFFRISFLPVVLCLMDTVTCGGQGYYGCMLCQMV
jgi:hypothetical protein